jgi:MFS family permease
MNAFAETAPLFAVAIVIWTFGEIAFFPTASALVADLAPTEMRGRYQGLFGMTGGLAAVMAPALGGLTLEHAGRVAVWTGCALVGVFAAGLQLALGSCLRKRLALAQKSRG